MINKIGFELDKRCKTREIKRDNCDKFNFVSEPNKLESMAGKLNLSYFVPFLGKKQKLNGRSKLDTLMFYIDTPANNLLENLKKEAYGYENITTMHVMKHALTELADYIEDLNNGKKDFILDSRPPIVQICLDDYPKNMFESPSVRKKILPVVKQKINEADEILNKNNPHKTQTDIGLSADLIDGIWDVREEKESVTPYTIYDGAISSNDKQTFDFVREMSLAFKKQLMLNEQNTLHTFSGYRSKAENIVKNLSLGTNIMVTYDASKESHVSFMDTVKEVLKQSEKKYEIIDLNLDATPDFFAYMVNTAAKNKDKEYVIIANPSAVTINDSMDDDDFCADLMSDDLTKTISKHPANVKFLLYDTRDNYYSTLSSKPNLYAHFEEAAIPALSVKQMIDMFKENPSLIKIAKKSFTDKAIEKTVEASTQLEGVFPTKTQELIKKIARYYADKENIDEKDVANYIKEATNLFKKDADDSSIDIIFDTGKKLEDIVGKASTQKEAALIVKQIETNKLGTKGIILYSQDGSTGSGRRHTAKAIAGEAGVPYIEMNAVDFGTKDVDLFGGGALSPEKAVKKLFSMVKTQAEANANKSAVLFIENFEYFTLGEMVSFYHQKAMAQLLREMEKADEAGLNILVAGSVSDPSLIGEATMKSFKFVDTVEVSSPAFSKQDRADIIAHSLKDNNIKLAGSSDEQKQSIDYAAEITQYFPFIQLKSFVKKANSVADERGHDAVTKGDMTEAYLQLATGRPASKEIEKHSKNIVSSHECGHAVNLEVMNNVAKTIGRPWHIPSKVNFVTLDPRGFYGGAVYHGNDKNDEYSFEHLFGDIVCSFGGNSAESLFYGIDGSLGITCDMESVRDTAESMVKSMGMGAKTGKMTIDKYDDLSDKMKQMIEDDERVIINNAKITSDMITEIYADFNKWFTQKYSPLVGTGDCIIHGDEFRDALNKWKSEQSPEKQKELALCDKTIVQIMEATKKGIAVRKA